MNDGRNRRLLAAFGLLLAVGGGLSVCLGAGVFGSARSGRSVFDGTVIRWWNEGGWKSFAVVVAIGLAALLLGVYLVVSRLRGDDTLRRIPTVTFERLDGTQGETTLRAPALSRGIEADLQSIPEVQKATVGLFGTYPSVEMRAVLEVSDDIDLEHLPARVDEAIGRLETTIRTRPERVFMTLRFKHTGGDRRLA